MIVSVSVSWNAMFRSDVQRCACNNTFFRTVHRVSSELTCGIHRSPCCRRPRWSSIFQSPQEVLSSSRPGPVRVRLCRAYLSA